MTTVTVRCPKHREELEVVSVRAIGLDVEVTVETCPRCIEDARREGKP